MKKIGLILLVLFCYVNTNAQQNRSSNLTVKLNGIVLDNDTNQGLEYATIVLTPLNGKELTGGITDENGNFSIPVKKGSYDISIEFISFKPYQLKNQNIQTDTDLGTILLAFNAERLDEVEIIAEKSTVEIRLDKKIYNVGKDMTVKGGTASDVLDNVPSVEVDVEGNVSLRGNENVRILVDGKPSGLIGLTGASALRQLPAEAIEKVEVITSPSARYDAEGTAGILNIVLRKGKAQGFNGSFNAKLGHPETYGGSTNLNLRTEKINFFTTIGYESRESPGSSFTRATYYDNENIPNFYRNEDKENDRTNKSFNFRFGMEFYLSEKSSITSSILLRDSNGDDIGTNYINEFDPQKTLLRTNERTETGISEGNTLEYNVNFAKNFSKDGHKLTMDFKYGTNKNNSSNKITDFDMFPSLMERNPERNMTDRESEDIMIKGDYVLPINENAQFEFGFKADLNQTESDYLVEDFDDNTQQYFNNTNFSNTLDFEQNIYSLYTQYGKKVNKFSYLLGLRMESTDRTVNLLQTQENFESTFTEFFPTVNLGYEFSDEESLTLGYSRRLRRPWFWFLNPFESRTSETYIMTGNVNLDPTFTHSLDFGYLKRWNKFTLNSSIYYQHSTSNMMFIQRDEIRDIDDVPTLVIIRSPINLGKVNRVGIEFNSNYNPYKWWRLSASLNLYKSKTTGDYEGRSYDSENETFSGRFDSRITLPGKIDWQTSARYRGPSESAYSKRKGSIGINLAFSKDILKDKGTLSFNVSDLLNSRKYRTTNVSPSTITQGEFQWRQRTFLLNFTYRLNQKKQRQRQMRDFEGGQEEMFKA